MAQPQPQPAAPRRTFNTKPSIDTSTPAINAQPVEIDGTPTSPQARKVGSWNSVGSSASTSAGSTFGASLGASLGAPTAMAEEEDALEEFGLRGRGESEARAKLLSSRKSDPAVLVDIPQGPSVEELELAAARAAARTADRSVGS